MRKTPERQRVDQLYAGRIYLRQLRLAGDTWSDGRTVYRGVELEKLRRDTLAFIMSRKERNPSKRIPPEMMRLSKNIVGSPGYLGQEDEAVSEWLSRLIMKYLRAGDRGSIDRGKVARRWLRKNFPEASKAIPADKRYNHREMTFITRSRAKCLWKVSRPVSIDELGITINAGVAAIPSHLGFVVEVGDQLVDVKDSDVQKCGRVEEYGFEDYDRHTAVSGSI